MRQQVNLYRSEFSQQLPFPNVRQGLQVLGVIAVVMLLVIAWQGFQLSQSSGQLQAIYTQMDTANAELETLQANLPADRMKPVEQQIIELNEELVRLREIRELMAGQQGGGELSGNQQGFSDQFEGLARQYIKGVSLSAFTFYEGGKQVELAGVAAPPALAPRYLAGLTDDQAFTDVAFGQLAMQRDSESGQVVFEVMRQDQEEQE